MSQGIIITLIICGTILLLGLGGMVIAFYAISKGMSSFGKMMTGECWGNKEKHHNKKENNISE
ncbi:MAG: hypothetical protein PHE49_00370 [bacterium]|nr:hypothetical protein [bacterium]